VESLNNFPENLTEQTACVNRCKYDLYC